MAAAALRPEEGSPPSPSAEPDSRNDELDAAEFTLQLQRLRRLRERFKRTLPLHLGLLATVAGGGMAVVQVWAEALWVAVLEPLQGLCARMPVGPATSEVLCLCLEHGRIAALFGKTRQSLSAPRRRAGGGGCG